MSPSRPRVAHITTATRGSQPSLNEDRIFTTPTAVVVLDGASQPDPTTYDGGWIADTIGRALQAESSTAPYNDLQAMLANVVRRFADQYQLPREAPSTTIAVVRWTRTRLDVLVLGDSPVAVFTRDNLHTLVTDDRLAKVTTSIRETGGAPDFRSLAAAQRTYRNRPDGYWIVEADPNAAQQAVTARWPLDQVIAVLVTTDGVSRGIALYGVPANWDEALALATHSPDALIQAVHNVEKSDPERVRWPRVKVHDDKSVALIRFE